VANYNYTHGATTNANRLRFLIGDHRGTNGTSATGWLFSDEELSDVLTLTGNDLVVAARLCLVCRINREAMAAGVAGTTDTSDRPAAIATAVREVNRLDWPGRTGPVDEVHTDEDDLTA